MKEFRNIKEAELDFDSKINLFYGENGQGKTSLLEAIFTLCFTRSFRERSDRIIKNHNSNGYELNGFFKDHKQNFNIRTSFSGEKKAVFLNRAPIKKFSELIGTVPVVALTPDDLKLTTGSPGERRVFFDVVIAQVYPAYLDALQAFREAVRQKNEILSGSFVYAHERELLSSWNEVIAKNIVKIVENRNTFCQWLNEHADENYQQIAGKKHHLKIKYTPSVSGTEEEIRTFLDAKIDSEVNKKQSLYGPHRDDISIGLNGYSIRQTGSQGENKTAVIVLKLLEIKYLHQFRHTAPIILFDDIFSELDEYRIHNLLGQVTRLGQVFVTSTTPWYKGDEKWNIRYFQVAGGEVARG